MTDAEPGPQEGPAPLVPAKASGPLTQPQRERVVEQLTRGFADDALSLDEFERRAELVYRATTNEELLALVADLPVAQGANVAGTDATAMASSEAVEIVRSVLGNTERAVMRMPRRLRIVSFMGNAELDLRQATFAPGITEIEVRNTLGNVELQVPENARVEVSCSNILSSVDTGKRWSNTGGGEPPIVIRITGRLLLSNLEISYGPGDDD